MSRRTAGPDREAATRAPRNPSNGNRALDRLELATLVHLGIFLLLASWGFGGNAPWSRTAMCWWGTLGALLTALGVWKRSDQTEMRSRAWHWLWPSALFNTVVVISLFNPNFQAVTMGSEVLFGKTGGLGYLPGSARPELTRQALWLFDGIYFSCFNLVLCVRHRRSLRWLLLVAAGNAVVLAVFGSMQKLLGSPGLYFGRVPSPQVYFFASFIYHNHWGAFAVLMTAVSLGLVAYELRRSERDFWHSPAFGGLVAVFFLAASIPLSTSRSCTLLVTLLLGGALLQALGRSLRQRRAEGRSVIPPLAGALAALVIAGSATYEIAETSITQRIADTRLQFTQAQIAGGLGSRAILYHDTWAMAKDRLLWGWGMASYPTVFYLYNTHPINSDGLPSFYYDAHSDWLQSLAEVGFVGTLLLGLHGLMPLWSLRRRPGPLPAYLFAGCTLIVLYAWIEFPFGSPAVVLSWWLVFFAGLRYARLDARDGAT